MILGVELRVALLAEADDAGRIRVVAFDADDDRLRPGQHPHARRRADGCAFRRLDLRKRVGHVDALPDGLVEDAVDDDGANEGAGA